MRMAVNRSLAFSDKSLAAILADYRYAFQVLRDSENASIIAKEVTGVCRFAEDSG